MKSLKLSQNMGLPAHLISHYEKYLENKDNTRIIARDILVSNDCYKTKLNNNDLVIGTSGAGKTLGYVIPNLLHSNESMIIADTKGNLYQKFGQVLKQKGFDVMEINFNQIAKSKVGYNPFHFIDANNEQQVFNFANFLIPKEDRRDPFWENAARQYVRAFIPFVKEYLHESNHDIATISDMIDQMHLADSEPMKLFNQYISEHPNGISAKEFFTIANNAKADKMHASIKGIASEKISTYRFQEVTDFFHRKKQIDFKKLGQRKTAVFLNISDTGSAMYRLINLFYTQAFHELCNSADRDYSDHRLKFPVRFIFDDFATNTVIPKFENIISVIRSRGISVSIIVQSLTQLSSLYGPDKMATIVNNCDTLVYLGGQDTGTAHIISEKINRTLYNVLTMPLDDVLVFIRGQEPKWTKRFDYQENEMEY